MEMANVMKMGGTWRRPASGFGFDDASGGGVHSTLSQDAGQS